MRQAGLILAALALLLIASVSGQAAKRSMNTVTAEIMTRSVEDFVRPGYAYFLATAKELSAGMNALCVAPSPKNLTAARSAFSGAVNGWSEIEMVRFGPIVDENRLERILFYPDPRGTALRQVQAMFASGDFPQDLVELERKSVALQGFTALEYVLFGTGSENLATTEPKSAARCAYGVLVAKNIETIARKVDESWSDPDGIAVIWMKPGLQNPVLRSSREALVELLGTIVHGIEAVRDLRLRPFLGEDLAHPHPRRALFWRSQNTMSSVRTNLEALQFLFETSGMALALPPERRSIAPEISNGFAEAVRLAGSLDGPIEAMLANAGAQDRLRALMDTLQELKILTSEDYGNAVGLTAGFSFADGD